jgi:aspartyl/asparaginyl beta-hydroxylase (cupin superfamily)
MITKEEIHHLYRWSKETTFPTKKAPTTEGYSNKNINHYWIKSVAKTVLIRKKLMTDKIIEIYENDEILYSGYSIFDPGTVLKPHRDPSIYREPYKRIQIPISIPEKEKCYMTWKDEKIYWEEGVHQVFDVVNNIHDGGNLSNKPMVILFVDVKLDTIVE